MLARVSHSAFMCCVLLCGTCAFTHALAGERSRDEVPSLHFLRLYEGGFGGLCAKYRVVDTHGVPKPESSPTGDEPDDSLPSVSGVDMHNLTMQYSCCDFAVPLEGDWLKLSFQRTARPRSHRLGTEPEAVSTGHALGHALGCGWATNLDSRVVIYEELLGGATWRVAEVQDAAGNPIHFVEREGRWTPASCHSLHSDVGRYRLASEGDSSLVLTYPYGTRHVFQRVAQADTGRGTTRYRLQCIEDLNGNAIEYRYAEEADGPASAGLPSDIFDRQHPERRLSFLYRRLKPAPELQDNGWRVVRVTDAMDFAIEYEYYPSGAPDGQEGLLRAVVRAEVSDPGKPERRVRSAVRFAYTVRDLKDVWGTGDGRRETGTRTTALAEVLDARGTPTRMVYQPSDFACPPSRFGTLPTTEGRLVLQRLETLDGPVVFETLERTAERVRTRVVDSRGTKTDYLFELILDPEAGHPAGCALYGHRLTRTTHLAQGELKAVFEWAPTPWANLTRVIDMSGNIIDWHQEGDDPDDPCLQPLNVAQPHDPIRNPRLCEAANLVLRRVVDPQGLNLETRYRYDPGHRRRLKIVDAEGRTESWEYDAHANLLVHSQPLQSVSKRKYDHEGFVTWEQDPDNRTTVHAKEFHPDQRESYRTVTDTVTGYAGEMKQTEVTVTDRAGYKRSAADDEGGLYRYGYDAQGRFILSRYTAPPGPEAGEGRQLSYEVVLDENGNQIRIKQFDDTPVWQDFDAMNRLVRKRQAASGRPLSAARVFEQNVYDATGSVLRKVEADGTTTESAYDELLRQTSSTVTRLDTRRGKLVESTTTTAYGRNAGSGAFTILSGWQGTAETNPSGATAFRAYDAIYRCVRTVERVNCAPGISMDGALRSGESEERFAYNKTHKIVRQNIQVVGPIGLPEEATRYLFRDELDRLTVEAFLPETAKLPPGVSDGMTVNDALAFPAIEGARITRRVYDRQGNLVTEIQPDGKRKELKYDGAGQCITPEQGDNEDEEN